MNQSQILKLSATARQKTDEQAKSVGNLVTHANVLSRQLQALLDRQWDGLAGRKGKWISKARAGIEKTMGELLDTQVALADVYQSQIATRKSWLEKTKAIQDKITILKGHIDEIESESAESIEINNLEKEQSGINAEINQLLFNLKQLESRKKEIANRLMHLRSIVESKSSSFKHEIEMLSPTTSLSSPSSTSLQIDQQVESYTREVDAITGQYEHAELEISALRDGVVVWKDACITVQETESKLLQSLSNSTILDKGLVNSLLESAVSKLSTHLSLAKSNNWSLLTVAISHELEAMKEAHSLVNPDASDPANSSNHSMHFASENESEDGTR